MTDNTTVDRAARSFNDNLSALTPGRILALYALMGFLFVGVHLTAIAIPFDFAFAAFVFFALLAAHTYQREGPVVGVDLMVGAWNVLAATMILVELGILAIPFTEEWAALVIVLLLTAHGYVVTEAE